MAYVRGVAGVNFHYYELRSNDRFRIVPPTTKKGRFVTIGPALLVAHLPQFSLLAFLAIDLDITKGKHDGSRLS